MIFVIYSFDFQSGDSSPDTISQNDSSQCISKGVSKSSRQILYLEFGCSVVHVGDDDLWSSDELLYIQHAE